MTSNGPPSLRGDLTYVENSNSFTITFSSTTPSQATWYVYVSDGISIIAQSIYTLYWNGSTATLYELRRDKTGNLIGIAPQPTWPQYI